MILKRLSSEVVYYQLSVFGTNNANFLSSKTLKIVNQGLAICLNG